MHSQEMYVLLMRNGDGKIDDADGVGEVGNAKCGDIMKIYIKVDNNIITDVKI